VVLLIHEDTRSVKRERTVISYKANQTSNALDDTDDNVIFKKSEHSNNSNSNYICLSSDDDFR
jgi:hypothetical protein